MVFAGEFYRRKLAGACDVLDAPYLPQKSYVADVIDAVATAMDADKPRGTAPGFGELLVELFAATVKVAVAVVHVLSAGSHVITLAIRMVEQPHGARLDWPTSVLPAATMWLRRRTFDAQRTPHAAAVRRVRSRADEAPAVSPPCAVRPGSIIPRAR
jgi:hypothetical protein